MNKNIIWLASYPKSGNTWLRAILSSLINSRNGEFNFDYLKLITNFEQSFYYEFVKKLNMDDFNSLRELKTISKYWIKAQLEFNEKNIVRIFKTHSANISFLDNHYTNSINSKGLIYMIRDPRDVVISYANHLNKSIDQTINIIQSINALTYSGDSNYPGILSTWEYHVSSWINFPVPKIVIKYEDLINNTENKILELIFFLEKKMNFEIKNKKIVEKIIKNTSFEKMKKKEIKDGFPEASSNSNFFRSGKEKQWKKILTPAQSEVIVNGAEKIMKKFNYL